MNKPYPLDTTSDMPSQVIGSSSPAQCSPASFDAGVWFQSACSGLWYEVKNAAGDISAVKIDGRIYKRQENVPDQRPANEP